MLVLKPNCELCDKDLPPESLHARICSYECTFCAGCVEQALENVCPNCGGGFVARPIRPAREWRKGVSLYQQVASAERVNTEYSPAQISAFAQDIKHIKPEQR